MKMSKMDKWLCIILESDIDGTKRIFNSDGKGEWTIDMTMLEDTLRLNLLKTM